MENSHLYALLRGERSPTGEEKQELDMLASDYPYFHALHTLRCAIKFQDSFGARDRIGAIRTMAGALPRPVSALDWADGYGHLRLAQQLDEHRQVVQAEQERLEREEQERLAEAERIALQEQAKRAEEQRIAEERRLEEEARLAEEQRIAEEQRLEEEAHLAEEQRVTEELGDGLVGDSGVSNVEEQTVMPADVVQEVPFREAVIQLNVDPAPFDFIEEDGVEVETATASIRSAGSSPTEESIAAIFQRSMASEGSGFSPAAVNTLSVEEIKCRANIEYVRTELNSHYQPPSDEERLATFIEHSQDLESEFKIAIQQGIFIDEEDLGDLSKTHTATSERIVPSEALARIYASRGMHEQAGEMYEALMVAYPEKRTYFAQLIEELPPVWKDRQS